MRQSQITPQRPSAHFNIQHSELSTFSVTSDNIQIIPHVCENNNTSSSSSNGQPGWNISHSEVERLPQPHTSLSQFTDITTASSNGCVPTFSIDSAPQDSDFQPRGTTQVLVHEKDYKVKVDNGQKGEIKRERTVPVPDQLPFTSDAMDYREDPMPSESDPFRGYDRYLRSPTTPRSPSCGGIDKDALLLELGEPKFAQGDELEMPLPTPCTAFSQPHAEFTAPLPARCSNRNDTLVKNKHSSSRKVLRSNSFTVMSEDSIGLPNHCYVNMIQELSSKGSVHDDSLYYSTRFYYNIGFIKSVYSRMSKKLKRRDRLSKEMQQVDYSKLDNHEQWYDRDYKIREQDQRFCK